MQTSPSHLLGLVLVQLHALTCMPFVSAAAARLRGSGQLSGGTVHLGATTGQAHSGPEQGRAAGLAAATLQLSDRTPEERLGDLVLNYGYPLEHHRVETADGYLLSMFRIPYGANTSSGHVSGRRHLHGKAGPRPVVLLQHGLLDSCAGFLVNGPGASLAFLLVDEGYDVWLGNVRGSTLSRTHAWLDTSDERYWMFSYDEMAQYDLPAMVRYVLDATGVEQLRYVGHSQGTTVLLAALSLPANAWMNEAIVGAALLAPVAMAKHLSSVPLLFLASLSADSIFTLLGVHEFMPSAALVAQLEGGLCLLQPGLCVNILAAIAGYNADNLDMARLPLYLSYTPAGSSVQNMAHWAQAVRARAPNSLAWFDFGSDCGDGMRCNQLRYGQPGPPLYNLTAVATRLALFNGGNDRLATPLDTEYLLESLRPGVAAHVQLEPSYEHLDFIWGISAPQVIYQDVISFLRNPRGKGTPAGGGAAAAEAT